MNWEYLNTWPSAPQSSTSLAMTPSGMTSVVLRPCHSQSVKLPSSSSADCLRSPPFRCCEFTRAQHPRMLPTPVIVNLGRTGPTLSTVADDELLSRELVRNIEEFCSYLDAAGLQNCTDRADASGVAGIRSHNQIARHGNGGLLAVESDPSNLECRHQPQPLSHPPSGGFHALPSDGVASHVPGAVAMQMLDLSTVRTQGCGLWLLPVLMSILTTDKDARTSTGQPRDGAACLTESVFDAWSLPSSGPSNPSGAARTVDWCCSSTHIKVGQPIADPFLLTGLDWYRIHNKTQIVRLR